jgi:hypothetical protein
MNASPVGDESLLLSHSDRKRLPHIRERHPPHLTKGWLGYIIANMDEHLAFGFLDMDMRGCVIVVIDVEAKAIFIPNLWHASSTVAFSDASFVQFSKNNLSALVMQLVCFDGLGKETLLRNSAPH